MLAHSFLVMFDGGPGDGASGDMESRHQGQREGDVELLLVELNHERYEFGPIAVVIRPPAAGFEVGEALGIKCCSGRHRGFPEVTRRALPLSWFWVDTPARRRLHSQARRVLSGMQGL